MKGWVFLLIDIENVSGQSYSVSSFATHLFYVLRIDPLRLHVFECSKCQHEQKHVTSTPSPMGLSYSSVCERCNEMRTFSFVREGDRRRDWYENTLIQIKKKKERDRLLETQKRKAGRSIKKASN